MDVIGTIFNWSEMIIVSFSRVAGFFSKHFRASELYDYLPGFFLDIFKYLENIVYNIPIIGNIVEYVHSYTIIELIMGPGLLVFLGYSFVIYILNIVT